MVEVSGSRLLQLSRSARQHGESQQLSGPSNLALASCAAAAEPARPEDVGAVVVVGRSLDSECQDPSSPPKPALRRQVSEVGAVCSNSARTDLCGGRGVNQRPYRDKTSVGPQYSVFIAR